MQRDDHRFIHRLARRVTIEWLLSLVLGAVVVMGLLTRPWITVALLLGVGLGLAALLPRFTLPKRSALTVPP
ncbi:MAG: hypothetical protein ACP5QO_05745 [Clostridia bacterium]